MIWAGDFGELPDPDAIDTGTDERYLDFIPTDAVIAAARHAGMKAFRLAIVRQNTARTAGPNVSFPAPWRRWSNRISI